MTTDFSAIEESKFISLTTYRRDGTPVPTTVMYAGSDGRYLAMSQRTGGKVRRIRNNGRVAVTASDPKGIVPEGAPVFEGTAELVEDEAAAAEVVRQVKGAYGFVTGQLIVRMMPLMSRMRGRSVAPYIGIRIDVTGT